MKKVPALSTLLLLLGAGCANYITTSELANRLDGQVRPSAAAHQAVVTGEGHEITVESGTRLVLVDGKAVLLRHPARVEHGTLKVSDEVLQFVPKGRPQSTSSPVPTRDRHYHIRSIVIDPGHGGHDPGASYGGVHEKTVALDVARETAAELRRSGMHVTLTREGDTFLTLEQRSTMANRLAADLFVSIHANAAPDRRARGIEIFYLAETFTHGSRRFDDATRAVELNAVHYGVGAGGGASGSHPPVTPALLAQRRGESRELAQHIERAMVAQLGVGTRGSKPAGFAVLKWTCSPAVLVEVGFLSNAADRRLLAGVAYRRRVARAVAQGILSYREYFERVH